MTAATERLTPTDDGASAARFPNRGGVAAIHLT